MRWFVGSYYSNSKYIGIFKCVCKVDGEAYFRKLNEEKHSLDPEMKSSEDGYWTLVDTDMIPQRYQYIEE